VRPREMFRETELAERRAFDTQKTRRYPFIVVVVVVCSSAFQHIALGCFDRFKQVKTVAENQTLGGVGVPFWRRAEEEEVFCSLLTSLHVTHVDSYCFSMFFTP